ncbi:1,4-alpha-glucan branching protein GlgB [Planococcus salinus]|uniref:1,4-alpha-glucan branching enzyme n=2 Tax=Planococcus salinus TaxID=1848460 RepID=A0A3M8P6G1_9BACL|nr:1,4-alpha-glucan branching protein GlgB [Planococcus salinus]
MIIDGGAILIKQLELLTQEKLADFHNGRMIDAYLYFGVHLDQDATVFTVWAPDVKKVTVVCSDAGELQEERFDMQMHPLDNSVWQVSIPKRMVDVRYEYEITAADGEILRKSDPYAQRGEMRPKTRSVVSENSRHVWSDSTLHQKKNIATNHYEKPMTIYELHIGTWKRNDKGEFLSYRELADELLPYIKELGFTHIEILPITEHPLDESWGYQTTGFFAPTIRYGTADDLKYLVEQCAENGIGLFLDWVPGHFCVDDHALACFNGTYLYEEARPERRTNPDWGTLNFDVQKGEVVSFILSSAHYWLSEFKFDGLRMDALVNLLFIPNRPERPHNDEGADFLRNLTTSLKQHYPDAILIAEDAWHYPDVTKDVKDGGVGFHYKWNFGWMRDTQDYMQLPPSERPDAHKKINFAMIYYYNDRFISTFSHDEFVHGRGSLLNKFPGTIEEKFHQLRLLLGFWITFPGKKLLFMGQEFGQFEEWKFQPELEWYLLKEPKHLQMATFTKELLAFYKSEKALYELDDRREGFTWLDANNHEQSVASFIRRGFLPQDECVVVCNFSDRDYAEFTVGVPAEGDYEQVFCTAHKMYGGGTEATETVCRSTDIPADEQTHSIKVELPAFAMCVWKPKRERGEAK